jgi:hypothetical protein
MKVVIRKRLIYGDIHTKFGTFPVLSLAVSNTSNLNIVSIVDPEGFENFITVGGDFIILPNPLPVLKEVKYVISDEEEAPVDKTKNMSYFYDGTKEGEAVELQPDDTIFDLRNGGVD